MEKEASFPPTSHLGTIKIAGLKETGRDGEEKRGATAF